MKYLLVFIIKVYQICLGPFVGSVCRFNPTCSVYAVEALKTRGCFVGSWLTIKRLCKCHPWHPGGNDNV